MGAQPLRRSRYRRNARPRRYRRHHLAFSRFSASQHFSFYPLFPSFPSVKTLFISPVNRTIHLRQLAQSQRVFQKKHAKNLQMKDYKTASWRFRFFQRDRGSELLLLSSSILASRHCAFCLFLLVLKSRDTPSVTPNTHLTP